MFKNANNTQNEIKNKISEILTEFETDNKIC